MKKIMFLGVIGIAAMLAGCETTTKPDLIRTEFVPVRVNPSLFNCPEVKKLPNFNTLTDVQVSKLLVTLWKDNKLCVNSSKSVKKFLDNSANQIEKDQLKSDWAGK